MSAEVRMDLAWEQDFDDHVEANRRLYWSRLWMRAPLVGVLTLAAIGIVSTVHWIGAILVALLIAGVSWSNSRDSVVRRALEPHRDALVLGPVRWTVDAGGMAIAMPHRELRVSWSSVQRVVQTSGLVLFYVSRTRAILVPKRALSDVAGFVEQVELWLASPGPHAPLVPPEAPWIFGWRPTLEDHIAFVAGVLAENPMRIGPMVIGGVLVMVSAQGMVTFLAFDEGLLVFGLPLALGIGGVAIGLAGVGGRVLRHIAPLRVRLARWTDPASFPLEPMAMRVGPFGVFYETPRGCGRVDWTEISEVVPATGCVNLMFGRLLGFSVPDHQFPTVEERDRFVADATGWQATVTHKTEVGGERGVARESQNPFAPPEGR